MSPFKAAIIASSATSSSSSARSGSSSATSGNTVEPIDDLDRRILAKMQDDCSLNNLELAASVHASAPTTLRRVRKLREAGYIEKQVAILAPEKLDASLTAIVEITLENQAAEVLQAFEAAMLTESAVSQCYRVSSSADFIVVIQVRDMNAYHNLVHRAFTAHARVRNVRTFFSTHRAKFETRIAL